MKNNQFYAKIYFHEIKLLFDKSDSYRFQTHETAFDKLAQLKERYTVSNPNTISYDPENELILWIQGYNVGDLCGKGYLGNFVKLRIVKKSDYYTLDFEDLDIPLKQHPRRIRPKQPHPDWGHPILRKIGNPDKNEQKNLEFENEKEAESLLLNLYNEFPQNSYVYPNRIITLVFTKLNDGSKGVKSYIFDVVQKENGKYQIVVHLNDYKRIQNFKIFNYAFNLVD